MAFLVAILLIILASLLLTTPVQSATTKDRASAADLSAEVEQYLADYSGRNGLPGAAAAVVKDGEVVTQAATGDITTSTRLPVGSVGKTMTSFAVLQLVDSGDVDLDKPITTYLPEFKPQGTGAADITVRQLLAHTSGLPNPTLVPAAESLEQRVDQIADIELASNPGTTFTYSNLNYQTLGRLVEVVSETQFSTYLKDNIFAPLDMGDTSSVVVARDVDEDTPGHVTLYGLALSLPEMDNIIAGAGGVMSTAEDMSKWLAMIQRGGTTANGEELLPRELLHETFRPQAGSEDGLGWERTKEADPAQIGKSGSMTRYSAHEAMVPSSGYGVVVLLDSYTTTYSHPFTIASGIIDLTEGKTPELGIPQATLIDLTLGLVTLIVLGFGLLGWRKASQWASKRTRWPGWRFGLRLIPQLVMPALAVYLFAALPLINGNSATALDVFGLWPAAAVLILALAIVGVALTLRRVSLRGRESRDAGLLGRAA